MAVVTYNTAINKSGTAATTHTVGAGKMWKITSAVHNLLGSTTDIAINGTTYDLSSSDGIPIIIFPIYLAATETIKGVTAGNWLFSGIEYTIT